MVVTLKLIYIANIDMLHNTNKHAQVGNSGLHMMICMYANVCPVCVCMCSCVYVCVCVCVRNGFTSV